jgi:hypothetical protein
VAGGLTVDLDRVPAIPRRRPSSAAALVEQDAARAAEEDMVALRGRLRALAGDDSLEELAEASAMRRLVSAGRSRPPTAVPEPEPEAPAPPSGRERLARLLDAHSVTALPDHDPAAPPLPAPAPAADPGADSAAVGQLLREVAAGAERVRGVGALAARLRGVGISQVPDDPVSKPDPAPAPASPAPASLWGRRRAPEDSAPAAAPLAALLQELSPADRALLAREVLQRQARGAGMPEDELPAPAPTRAPSAGTKPAAGPAAGELVLPAISRRGRAATPTAGPAGPSFAAPTAASAAQATARRTRDVVDRFDALAAEQSDDDEDDAVLTRLREMQQRLAGQMRMQ